MKFFFESSIVGWVLTAAIFIIFIKCAMSALFVTAVLTQIKSLISYLLHQHLRELLRILLLLFLNEFIFQELLKLLLVLSEDFLLLPLSLFLLVLLFLLLLHLLVVPIHVISCVVCRSVRIIMLAISVIDWCLVEVLIEEVEVFAWRYNQIIHAIFTLRLGVFSLNPLLVLIQDFLIVFVTQIVLNYVAKCLCI